MKITDISDTDRDWAYSVFLRVIHHLGIKVKITVEDRNALLTAEDYGGKYKHHLEIYVGNLYLAYFSFRSPYVYGDALTNFVKDLLLCGKFSDYNKNAFLEFFKA